MESHEPYEPTNIDDTVSASRLIADRMRGSAALAPAPHSSKLALPTFATSSLRSTMSASSQAAAAAAADDEALSKIFQSKHSKKVLYTGRKQNADGQVYKVGRLYDLSVRVLVDSLDDLPLRLMNHS